MAALRYYWCGCRSFMHLRRSISSSTALAKANKPTLIEEDTVEVKTVDQTVCICYHVMNVLLTMYVPL